MVDREKIDRLRALWKSGKDKFSSFYMVLNEVRQEIGNDALPHFCLHEVGVGISRVIKVRDILTEDDAARVKAEFTESNKQEIRRKQAEAHAERLAKIERENELARKRQENAEIQARLAAEKIAEKKAAQREATRLRREEKAHKEGSDRTRIENAILANPHASRAEIVKAADVSPFLVDQVRVGLEAAGRIQKKEYTSDEVKYEKLVSQGLIAKETADMSSWILGGLATEVSELRTYGGKALERYAKRIGVEYQTLLQYKAVSEAWEHVEYEIRIRIRFSIASILRKHPDRDFVIQSEPHMTCERAHEIMREFRGSNIIELNKVN